MSKDTLALILQNAKSLISRKEEGFRVTKEDLRTALADLRSAWERGESGVEEFLTVRDLAERVSVED